MHVIAFILLASTIGQIFSPIFHAMSWLLALYYSAVPNYVVAIAMLTITVMIVSFPLNRASTRSMFKMQLLQPEVQKLRTKYKPSRDMTVQERQEVRQKLNEEMMALYRENNVSMAGGCLPNLVIFPIFIVLYDVIRGLTNTCTGVLVKGKLVCGSTAQIKAAAHTQVLWAPRYIIQNTALYRNLHATNGKMIAFGINLASSVRTSQPSWVDVLPFVAVVLIAIGLQYVQLKQMTGRSTQTGQVAQQMQAMQKFMPLIMALIYLSIPAAVNIYFIFSSLFRISQQEWMYRRDPQIVHAMSQLKARRAAAAGGGKKKVETEAPPPPPPPGGGGLRGFRTRLASALAPEMMASDGAAGGSQSAAGSGGGSRSGTPARAGGTPSGAGRAPAKGQRSGGSAGASKAPAAAASKPAGGSPGTGATPRKPKGGAGTSNAGTSNGGAPAGNGSTPKTDGNGATAPPGASGKRQRRPQ